MSTTNIYKKKYKKKEKIISSDALIHKLYQTFITNYQYYLLIHMYSKSCPDGFHLVY